MTRTAYRPVYVQARELNDGDEVMFQGPNDTTPAVRMVESANTHGHYTLIVLNDSTTSYRTGAKSLYMRLTQAVKKNIQFVGVAVPGGKYHTLDSGMATTAACNRLPVQIEERDINQTKPEALCGRCFNPTKEVN